MTDQRTDVPTLSPEELWLHFTEMAQLNKPDPTIPMIVDAEGSWIRDANGKQYLDALSALYCVNLGYGNAELIQAATEQLKRLPFGTLWNFSHPPGARLSTVVAEIAPGRLNHTFFTLGGAESVESAWKLARQYHRLSGDKGKYKIIARQGAYHGVSMGALSVTGIESIREPFEPLVPGAIHAPQVHSYHADESSLEHSRWCAQEVGRIIEREGPETVAAVIVEPVQNGGGCLTAEPEYFSILRSICDEHDVLLIADETITAWGRIGEWFGSEVYGLQPDIITTAKAIASAYVPFGAVIASDRVFERFAEVGVKFQHGYTFGGHPVGAAVALATIDVIAKEGLLERVRESSSSGRVRDMLARWSELDIVGDVRGAGYFFAVELVRDRDKPEFLTETDIQRLTEYLPSRLWELGVHCRALHRGHPVLQFAPPLVMSDEEFDFLEEKVVIAVQEAQDLIK